MLEQLGLLSGVRIVDLTQMLSGPYCSFLLAGMGADVIKVEPLDGDNTRHQGPFVPDDVAKVHSAYFESVNRGKRSVVVNLKDEQGKEILCRLIKSSDVLLENFRAGVMDKLDLGYENLKEIKRDLVYACIRGFGDPRTLAGPYTNWPAFDVVAQAMGGLMGITGADADSPMKVGAGVGDIFPATLAAFAVACGVQRARTTGEGCFIDVSMYDAIISLCERIIYQYSFTGVNPTPMGVSHPFLCPFGNFKTSDGWVTIAAPRDPHWRELCELAGKPEYAADPRFITNAARVEHRSAVEHFLQPWCLARTKREILTLLGGRVPVGSVNTAEDIFNDEHARRREMLVELQHDDLQESLVYAGYPIKVVGSKVALNKHAPFLGQDTEDVLTELGYTRPEMEKFTNENVIKFERKKQ